MSLSKKDIKSAASDLFYAEKNKVQIPLISKRFNSMNMEDAYFIQDEFVKMKIEAGLTIKGWKIGLTSKAMQYALNINIPDSGILLDNMFFTDESEIPTNRFIETRVEAEIAFIFNKELEGKNISRQDIIESTEFVLPALEILDTRVLRKDPDTGTLRNVFDTISDNAANAGIVTGNKKHNPKDMDLKWVGALVHRNGDIEETGLGGGVLGDPIKGIIWLVNRLNDYNQKIRPGELVLSGSFIRPIEARKGDNFYADYGDFGKVECKFV
tara:strand:+ start:1668 stop:2474 length:807 start_codon:yes stop_codon:yes gene_type:complete